MHQSKWISRIVDLQREDGSWGYFHTLSSKPKLSSMTTEQALRRLEILGLDGQDEPVRKALGYMERCLDGKCRIPDHRERTHDWDLFTAMMLAAWIKRFSPDSPPALKIADRWAEVITAAFAGNIYDHSSYVEAYTATWGTKPKGGRFTDFVSFYQISLLQNRLNPVIEERMIDYILRHEPGIYYVHGKKLLTPPTVFSSLETSRYLGALELLAPYPCTGKKLAFAADWLISHRDENGWDLGSKAKDGIYFPLSDSWKNAELRRNDSTGRIERLLKRIDMRNRNF